MRKYHKKGIFTVNQLSYLFKPRRRKRKRAPCSVGLQPGVASSGAPYRQDIRPPTTVNSCTLHGAFLDIEGVPDRGTDYLIGLIVSAQGMLNAIPYGRIRLKTSEVSLRHFCVLSKNILTLPYITTEATSQRALSVSRRNMDSPVTQ